MIYGHTEGGIIVPRSPLRATEAQWQSESPG